jgi:hypothetical protein
LNIRELVTKITFESHHEPLEKIEGLLEGIHRKLEFLAAAEIAHKLFEISEKFASWGSEINTTASNLGMASDELQMLQFAAQKSGVGANEMSHSLMVLSKRLDDARQGSKEAYDSFARAGFTDEQIGSFKTAEDALFGFSTILQKTADPMRRTALAQEFLGRSGGKFVNFLKQGPAGIRSTAEEMRRLGLVLSGPQLEALEETEYSFQKLHAVMRGFGAMIASQMGPVFSFLIDKFLDFYAANRKLIEANIDNWLEGLSFGLGFVARQLLNAAGWVVYFAKTLHIDKNLLKFTGWLAGASGGLLTLGKTFKVVTDTMGPLGSVFQKIAGLMFSAEFLAIAAAIAAVTLAVHDVWAAANGEPLWTKQIGEWLKSFEPIRDLLDWIENTDLGDFVGDLSDSMSATITGIKKKFEGIFSPENLGGFVDFISETFSEAFTAEKVAGYMVTFGEAMQAAILALTFPLKIGWAIAEAFGAGMAEMIRTKFPALQWLMPKGGAETAPGADVEKARIEAIIENHGQGLGVPATGPAPASGAAPIIQNNTMNLHHEIHGATDAQKTSQQILEDFKNGSDEMLRKGQRELRARFAYA